MIGPCALLCGRGTATYHPAGQKMEMSMADDQVYPVSKEWAKRAWADDSRYQEMYKLSVSDPEGFWGEHGKRLDWIKPYTKVKNTSFVGGVSIKWFEDGVLNVSVNCVDRHLDTRADQTAIIFEGDEPSDSRDITYRELHDEVCRFANVLKSKGVRRGDRVTIYMPMIPEAVYAMLACARLSVACSHRGARLCARHQVLSLQHSLVIMSPPLQQLHTPKSTPDELSDSFSRGRR